MATAAGIVHWRQRALRARNEELEAKVRERTLELEASERRAQEATLAKSRFLASMSHELRTPLNAILGFAMLLRKKPERSQEDRDHLDRIHRAGEHLLGLINEVLSISKIEAGKLTLNMGPFALRGMVGSIAEMIGVRTHEKGLDLEVHVAPEVPDAVEGDEGKLRQVLINLLGNAVKFTSVGTISLSITQEDDRTRFEVRDTGAGISPQERDSLFGAFAQTEAGRRSREGTGLGLHISQAMVQLMGGEIRVESEQGKGSQFHFTLLLRHAETAGDRGLETREALGLAEGQVSLRVLVVDDRVDNRDLLRELLQGWGFQVKEAVDGQEGLELWEAWSPQVVWMDLRMPRLDGPEAVRRIRVLESELGRARTAIFALSASVLETDRSAVLAAGFDEFIFKPFQESQIAAAMEKHAGVRFLRAEASRSQESLPLQKEEISTLPEAWRKDFQNSLLLGDAEEALRLLETLEDATLAPRIASFVRAYRFDEILRTLDA
jgi:CheY-like chemotaxis protein